MGPGHARQQDGLPQVHQSHQQQQQQQQPTMDMLQAPTSYQQQHHLHHAGYQVNEQQHNVHAHEPQADFAQLQEQQYTSFPQQQQVWYELDARGKIGAYDEDDWFIPEHVPFKRRQNVFSTMAASRPHPWKRVRHHITAGNYQELPADTPTYVTLEAPPALYPPKRYCDITGCEAPYMDPKTHLRYANAEAFKIARMLSEEEVQARLAIRNAQSVLK